MGRWASRARCRWARPNSDGATWRICMRCNTSWATPSTASTSIPIVRFWTGAASISATAVCRRPSRSLCPCATYEACACSSICCQRRHVCGVQHAVALRAQSLLITRVQLGQYTKHHVLDLAMTPDERLSQAILNEGLTPSPAPAGV
eukprot:1079905-Prymnesium_polylepis.1